MACLIPMLFQQPARQDIVSANLITSKSKLHDHHIFPRCAHKKYSLPLDELDSICNRVPVLEETNLKLGEAYPDKYMKDMRCTAMSSGTMGDLARRLEDCLIPGDPTASDWTESLKLEKFGEFCRNRGDLILKRVKQVVGDSLIVGEVSADEQAEEDDITT